MTHLTHPRHVATLAPYFADRNCRCDPFDDGPFGHDDRCPASATARAVMFEWQRAAPMLEELARAIAAQDQLARASARDERASRTLRVLRRTLRRARRSRTNAAQDATHDEALQVAAAAIRLLRDTSTEARAKA